MNKFIGTKLLEAMPMTLGEYNKYQGWVMPEDQDPDAEGNLVEYLDGGKPNHPDHKGYISWSPKEQFDNAYRKTDGMNFGLATEAAKKGLKIARKGWNGAEMFAYITPADKLQCALKIVTDYFQCNPVPHREHWSLKTAQNDIATWAPSGSDSLADDWVIVD